MIEREHVGKKKGCWKKRAAGKEGCQKRGSSKKRVAGKERRRN